jgi:phage gpG-like protein
VISVEVNDRGVNAMLWRLQRSVSNMQPAMAEIGAALVSRIGTGFKGAKSPWGDKWKSLSQAAIMGRLSHRKDAFGKRGKITKKGQGYLTGGVQPLSDTGRLRSSITYRATDKSVEVGTNVPYARTHQFGARQGAFGRTRRNGPIPWGNIPARPFMPIKNNRADLPASWKWEVMDIIQARINEAAK